MITRTESSVCRKSLAIIAACLAFFSAFGASVVEADAEDTPDVSVAVYTATQSSLEGILEGDVGEAILLYYLTTKGPKRPSLVVRLSKQDEASGSVAHVFDVPPGQTQVPVTFTDSHPVISEELIPRVKIAARGGWWVRDDLVNYNLDITIYGPIAAMWASEGDTGWLKFLSRDTPNAEIVTRDSDGDGQPDWDWRTMLPEFRYRGDHRTTYAERMCQTPLVVDGGMFPAWPFVAGQGDFGYEQTAGIFRPPIVVDWEAGRVTAFSEIVTLRNQNCSYGMYSIVRVLPSQMNSPNFEVPFAFYDLSDRGTGFPNLIVRTERQILDAEEDGRASEQMEVIRYSWSNQAFGDGTMDYKIEVLGFHPYDFETSIADGQTWVDAPPYELFPAWVMGKAWPVATFVDSEDLNYRTSEGIYEWTPRDLGYDFFLGHTEQGNEEALSDIRVGLRGEYRLNADRQSYLYMSPIDNRLHLKWAEHGVWRLDEEEIIRVDNVDGDAYIDVWSREIMPVKVEGAQRATGEEMDEPLSAFERTESQAVEVLFALDSHLLHYDGCAMTIVAVDHQPALFEMLPPTDHDTWVTQRRKLAPYEIERRDPTSLRNWLEPFPGEQSEITGVSLNNVRITDGGYRFELTLRPDYRIGGSDLIPIEGLSPGSYLVEYQNDEFTVSPLVPPRLSLDIRRQHASAPAQVVITNKGPADATTLTLFIEIETDDTSYIELTRKPVEVLAGERLRLLVDIPAALDTGSSLTARLVDAEEVVVAVSPALVLVAPEVSRSEAIWSLASMPHLIVVFGLFAGFLALSIHLVVRREEMI